MRARIVLSVLLAACSIGGMSLESFGQGSVPQVASRTVAPQAPANQKFTFILFWKEDNAATQQMAAGLKAALAKRADKATWTGVKISDPANQSIVEQYKVSRAPMPMVLCVAPNGAITGGIPDKISEETVDRVMVTPTMTECMKALQDGKLVLVHVRPDDRSGMPGGANAFATDPEFKARTVSLTFRRDDPSETRFLADMEINPATANASIVSLLAPPGVLVGKFTAAATKDQIAEKLHAAGKCCDDPNCIHNQKAK